MKVFEFGAIDPDSSPDKGGFGPMGRLDAAILDRQMSLGHRYANALTEQERARRAAVRAIFEAHPTVAPLVPPLRAAEAVVTKLVEQISKSRRKNRNANASQADKDALRAARNVCADLQRAFGEAKRSIAKEPQILAAIEVVNEDDKTQSKLLRARFSDGTADPTPPLGSRTPNYVDPTTYMQTPDGVGAPEIAAMGLYWGTYCIVEQAAQQARSGRDDPRFRRWTGDGHIAVQLQNGLDVAAVFGTPEKHDTRVWIQVEPGRDRVLHLRVGTLNTSAGKRGKPHFIRIRFKVPTSGSRKGVELPPGKIKWVHLLRRRVANIYRWSVQFVVDETPVSVAVARQDCASVLPQTVGIDVGWRLKDDGSVRVAVGVGQDGSTHEMWLSKQFVDSDQKVADLASIRSQHLETLKERFAAWLASPESIALGNPANIPGLAMWGDPYRFWRVLRGSTEPPVQVSLGMRDEIMSFMDRDRHLQQWQENQRMKLQHQRREIFRLFAVSLARRYQRVVIEDFDLREVAKRGPVEDDTVTDSRTPMRMRGLACVSGFRQILKNACASRHVEVVTVPAAFTTKTCSSCSAMNDVHRDKILHTCTSCGVTWDQDENAARNLMRMGPVEPPNPVQIADALQTKRATRSGRQTNLRKNKKTKGAGAGADASAGAGAGIG